MASGTTEQPLRQAPVLHFDLLTDIEWKLLYQLNYELDDRMQSLTFRHLEIGQKASYPNQSKGDAPETEHLEESIGVVRLGMRFPDEYYANMSLPHKGETDVCTPSTPIEIGEMAGQSIVEHLLDIRKVVETLPRSYFVAPKVDIDALRRENAEVEAELRREIEETRRFAGELDKWRRKIVLQRFKAAADTVDDDEAMSELKMYMSPIHLPWACWHTLLR